ncbi:MAG: ORC1-type DNA replication protein [Candidatus Bathyarchaeia archaeon]
MAFSLERRYFTVFKDEGKLDINYVPSRLPHRDHQLQLLSQFFRFALERPGQMAQRVLITGKIGTGKTVLSQRFGLNLEREARDRGINLQYVHVNCRECGGSAFLILQQAILKFYPNFPGRGYSAEELPRMLMQVLDEQNAHIIVALDEVDALIRVAGSDPLYVLTRIHEGRLGKPQRLSLICILREAQYLEKLDPSTRSTLQRNIIHLEEYSTPQLRDILKDRVDIAFRDGTVSEETLEFIAESAASEEGDARYAIELLWRAGKYADTSGSPEVSPEHVRRAAVSLYPTIRRDTVYSLGVHEKLFLLGLVRRFSQTGGPFMSMGEAEEAYAIACEEYGEKRRGYTQLWKYVKELSALGIIRTRPSGTGYRGKTTLLSLPKVPASDLERELTKALSMRRK